MPCLELKKKMVVFQNRWWFKVKVHVWSGKKHPDKGALKKKFAPTFFVAVGANFFSTPPFLTLHNPCLIMITLIPSSPVSETGFCKDVSPDLPPGSSVTTDDWLETAGTIAAAVFFFSFRDGWAGNQGITWRPSSDPLKVMYDKTDWWNQWWVRWFCDPCQSFSTRFNEEEKRKEHEKCISVKCLPTWYLLQKTLSMWRKQPPSPIHKKKNSSPSCLKTNQTWYRYWHW